MKKPHNLTVTQHLTVIIHRYIGACLAIFLFFITVTGMILNHHDDLKLDQKTLILPWQPQATYCQTTKGAVILAPLSILACQNTLWIFTQQGDIFEQLSSSHLPPGDILSVGTLNGHLIVKTEAGLFRFGQDLLSWTTVAPVEMIQWSTAETLAQTLNIHETETGQVLSDIILKLHTGKIFGAKAGKILLDIIGALLIILMISGLLKWVVFRKPKP